MGRDNRQEEAIDAILKDAYREIEPADSWAALRGRIGRTINGAKLPSVSAVQLEQRIAFWRRAALASAACLLVTAGLLVYTLGLMQGGRLTAPINEGLFSQAQLVQLKDAFSNVRELFEQQSTWIMLGSGNNAEIGLDPAGAAPNAGDIVVVRLAVNFEKQDAAPSFFDVVTFPSQRADFQLPLADSPPIRVSLRPLLKDDAIAVEINAQADGRAKSENTTPVDDEAFTSLVRLPCDGDWVTINGIAQSVSSI